MLLHQIIVETKIKVKKEVQKINRAQRLVAKTFSATSNKDEEKRAFYDIFQEIF
jgi:hypothetical protein